MEDREEGRWAWAEEYQRARIEEEAAKPVKTSRRRWKLPNGATVRAEVKMAEGSNVRIWLNDEELALKDVAREYGGTARYTTAGGHVLVFHRGPVFPHFESFDGERLERVAP